MSKFLIAVLLAFSSLFVANQVSAKSDYQNTTSAIEREYRKQNNGRMISDAQLSYYLDQADAGWSMKQIRQDIATTHELNRKTPGNSWHPNAGWRPRAIVCSSTKGKYRECKLPFQAQAIVTQRISKASCIEGSSWGQRQGVVWVNKGCRARFAVNTNQNNNALINNYTVTCTSDKKAPTHCIWDDRYGEPRLVQQLSSKKCIKGKNWAYYYNRDLWVTKGCSARFGSNLRLGSK